MGDYGRLKQDLIGEKEFHRSQVLNYGFGSRERHPSRLQSSDDRNQAAGGRRDRLSRSSGEIREAIADAVNSAQACGRGMELGKEKSHWNSSDQDTRTHSSTDRERDVSLADKVTLLGPSFTRHQARNDSHNGCPGPPEIEDAGRGMPNSFADSKGKIMGGVHTSSLNYEFLRSSGDGSIAGVAGGQSRHEYIANAGGREVDSGGGLPQGEVGNPFACIEKFENQEIKGDGTGVDLDRVCERSEHIRNEVTKNELLHHKKMEVIQITLLALDRSRGLSTQIYLKMKISNKWLCVTYIMRSNLILVGERSEWSGVSTPARLGDSERLRKIRYRSLFPAS